MPHIPDIVDGAIRVADHEGLDVPNWDRAPIVRRASLISPMSARGPSRRFAAPQRSGRNLGVEPTSAPAPVPDFNVQAAFWPRLTDGNPGVANTGWVAMIDAIEASRARGIEHSRASVASTGAANGRMRRSWAAERRRVLVDDLRVEAMSGEFHRRVET